MKNDPYLTYSEVEIDVENPKKEMFNIQDIARGLSNECRFNGQIRIFYCVAQHSVAVARLLKTWSVDSQYNITPAVVMAGLLHDASEAYLKDIPSPVKKLIPQYKEIEQRFMTAIYERFGVVLTEEQEHLIKLADEQIYKLEVSYLRNFYKLNYQQRKHLQETLGYDSASCDWYRKFINEFTAISEQLENGHIHEAWAV